MPDSKPSGSADRREALVTGAPPVSGPRLRAGSKLTPWQRLHSLTGVVPLAGYLLLHLVVQAFALGGEAPYRRVQALLEAVPGLTTLGPALLVLALVVHAVLGLSGLARPSAGEELAGAAGAGPSRRWVQVASGAFLLIFLLGHVFQFRGQVWLGALDSSDFFGELCASLSSTSWGGAPLLAVAYLAGVAAAALHCAHGLHRAGAGWALNSVSRRRVLDRGCVLLGVGLFLLGTLIVIELATGSAVIQLRGS